MWSVKASAMRAHAALIRVGRRACPPFIHQRLSQVERSEPSARSEHPYIHRVG